MRIMIVASSYPPDGWGGAEVAAEGIADWLASRDHDVAVYADADPPAPPGEGTGSSLIRLGPPRSRWTHRTPEHARQGSFRKALWHVLDHGAHQGEAAFARATAAFRPDVVMVHLAPGLGLGLFAHCAREDLPVLFVVHDFWMTCLRSSMFSKQGHVCTQRETLCRWSSHMRMKALARIPRLGYWAPSHSILEIIQREIGPVFRHVLVQRNVVDLRDFSPGPPSPPGGPVRLLFVGKLSAAKGARFIAECLARLPPDHPFVLNFVGSGDLEGPLRRAFADDPRFVFSGVCSRAEVAAHYQAASLLLIPSLWFENSPLVIYQAQAAGVPVLGSSSGGIPELLEGREDSHVLPVGDHDAWTARLAQLIRDPAALGRLTAAARRLSVHSGDEIHAGGLKVEALCRTLQGLPAGAAVATAMGDLASR